MTETKKDLVQALSDEMERLRTRIERLRLSNVAPGAPHLDKAAYVILGRLNVTGPERLSAVAHYFGLDVSTISRHVASLEEDGLIERTADPDDGRAQLLQLTTEGADLLHQIRSGKTAVIGEQLADWSKEDCSQFVKLLSRYNEAMEQRFGAAVLQEVKK